MGACCWSGTLNSSSLTRSDQTTYLRFNSTTITTLIFMWEIEIAPPKNCKATCWSLLLQSQLSVENACCLHGFLLEREAVNMFWRSTNTHRQQGNFTGCLCVKVLWTVNDHLPPSPSIHQESLWKRERELISFFFARLFPIIFSLFIRQSSRASTAEGNGENAAGLPGHVPAREKLPTSNVYYFFTV